MSLRIIDWRKGVVIGFGATGVTLVASGVIPTDCTVTVECNMVARRNAGVSIGSMASSKLYHRGKNVAGVLSLVGVPTVIQTTAEITVTVSVDVSAGQIRFRAVASGTAMNQTEYFSDMRIRIN